MNVPSCVLSILALILLIVLIIDFILYKKSMIAGICAILSIPVFYFAVFYGLYDFIPIERTKEIARYGQIMFFIVMIVLFTRIMLIHLKNKRGKK